MQSVQRTWVLQYNTETATKEDLLVVTLTGKLMGFSGMSLKKPC